MKYLGRVFIILILLAVIIPRVSCSANTNYIIAASNSSSSDKAGANAVCTGTNDQSVINKYIGTSGNTVILDAGTYYISGSILPASNTILQGVGNNTIINFNSPSGNYAYIYVPDRDNVEIGSLQITGSRCGVYIDNSNGNHTGYYIHDILSKATLSNDFVIYLRGGDYTTSNVQYVNCTADNPDGNGFCVWNNANSPTLNNITFYDCVVTNAGVASTRLHPWVTGIDPIDVSSGTLSNCQIIKCTVNGAWESDFHFEYAPTKQGVVILDCSATGAGQKPSDYDNGNGTTGPQYGAGFLMPFKSSSDSFIMNGNAGGDNALGDMRVSSGGAYTDFTPPVNMVFPAGSATVTRVNQGNCTGIVVTEGSVYDLYFYSTDGNAVDQTITLPNGNIYQATFTNYLVIRGVTGTTPTTSTTTTPTATLPSVATEAATGVTGTGATLNADLTGLGSASSVTTGFEYGTTTGYGSTIAGVPATLSNPGTFIASLTGLTPGTTYHYRAEATGDGTTYGSDQTFTTAAALTVAATSLPDGEVGTAYSQTLVATGGTTPYTWSVTGGSLPAGLTLSSGGVISGTPTAAGTSNFTVMVTDGAESTATENLSITVNSTSPSVTSSPATDITANSATLNGSLTDLGTAGSVSVSFQYGTTTSYGSSTAAQAMSASGPISANITGLTPGTTYHYRAEATGDGTTYGSDQTFTTAAALAFTTTSLPDGEVGTAYSQTLAATEGTTPYTWSISTGSLPVGLTLSSGGVISGTPTAAGTSNFTVTVTDGAESTATENLSITVTSTSPSVTTGMSGSITTNGDVLNGSLTSLGSASSVSVDFQYGPTASYGNSTAAQTMTATGPFSANLTGLTPGTTYHYRAVAVGDGTTYGADQTFTTATTPPSVATSPATNITANSATLNGSLTGLGTASSVTLSFEYGTTTGYGNTIAGVPATLSSPGTFFAALTGLTPGTTYHYRAEATGDGTTYGSDQTFTTAADLAFTTTSLPDGEVGTAYNQTLAATGGTTPYTWSVSTGSLPAGLTLSSGGVISGTPTIAGTSNFTVTVKDNMGSTATGNLSITVNAVTTYTAWDVNEDGTVNVLDMILVGQHYGETGTPGWVREDVNADGTVNVLDSILIGQHFSN